MIVGAGAGGLITALAAAESGAQVAIACGAPLGQDCNTAVSGGGFMMSTDQFSVEDHIELTLKAGGFLNDRTLVNILCEQANEAKTWLESHIGTGFNPKHNGQGYWFTQGGAGFFEALRQHVCDQSNIELLESCHIFELATDDVCHGAWAMSSNEIFFIQANATVLATGGYAGIYARHDNPGNPVGSGIALALNAGAAVRDMEFVQFYPLGLAEPTLPTFMAFRPFPPEAKVVNVQGESIPKKYLDTEDLNEAIGNHRDRFSQAIEVEQQYGPVKLDLTNVDWNHIERWFSLQFLTRYDFPWQTQAATISPIAHHTMGGIAVDEYGHTSVPNLYAVGEVASGLHGANRLGSNSLTECLVFGKRVGIHAVQQNHSEKIFDLSANQGSVLDDNTDTNFKKIQWLCWQYLGLTRNETGIQTAQSSLSELDPPSNIKLKTSCQVAQLVAEFAQRRTESRGAHQREDFPDEDAQQQQSQFAKLKDGKLFFVPDPFQNNL